MSSNLSIGNSEGAKINGAIHQFCKNYEKAIFITLFAIGIIVGLILALTGILGGLSIAGGHFGFLSPLHTALSSIWQGMPYLMTSLGGPGFIILLAGIIYGVVKTIKAFNNRKHPIDKNDIHSNNQGTGIGGGNNITSSSLFQSSPYYVVNEIANTITDGTTQYTLNTYSYNRDLSLAKKRENDDFRASEMRQKMEVANACFIYKDEKTSKYMMYYAAAISSLGQDFDGVNFETCETLEELCKKIPKDITILTDFKEFEDLNPRLEKKNSVLEEIEETEPVEKNKEAQYSVISTDVIKKNAGNISWIYVINTFSSKKEVDDKKGTINYYHSSLMNEKMRSENVCFIFKTDGVYFIYYPSYADGSNTSFNTNLAVNLESVLPHIPKNARIITDLEEFHNLIDPLPAQKYCAVEGMPDTITDGTHNYTVQYHTIEDVYDKNGVLNFYNSAKMCQRMKKTNSCFVCKTSNRKDSPPSYVTYFAKNGKVNIEYNTTLKDACSDQIKDHNVITNLEEFHNLVDAVRVES